LPTYLELVHENQLLFVHPDARGTMNPVQFHRHLQAQTPRQNRMQGLMLQNIEQTVDRKMSLPPMPIEVNHAEVGAIHPATTKKIPTPRILQNLLFRRNSHVHRRRLVTVAMLRPFLHRSSAHDALLNIRPRIKT
jgi:hypothetical protein